MSPTSTTAATPGLWRRTVRDIGLPRREPNPKWVTRGQAMQFDRAAIERAILLSKRDPARSLRERKKLTGGDDGAPLPARLSRCTAFGRWASPVPQGQEENAQFGLFGTSAAVQILSQSHWAESLIAGHLGGLVEWLPDYLRTVNFLDYVIQASAANDPPPVATEVALSLRACQAARAFASTAPVLDEVARREAQLATVLEQEVLDDLGSDLRAVSQRNVTTLMESLAGAQSPAANAPSAAFRPPKTTPTTPLYAFTQAAEDFPDNINDWVFLQASLLTTVLRCWAAQVLTDHTLAGRVLPEQSVAALRHVVEDPPPELDPRTRLLGLWAMSHLDHTTAGGPVSANAAEPAFLANAVFQEADVAWCGSQVRAVCAALLDREARLADTSSPYYFATDHNHGEYKSDHLVTPVVPLVIALCARYAPTFLSRRSVLDLLQACVKPEKRISVFAARPHQLSTEDGVVNLSYYHEANAEFARASDALSVKPGSRFTGHFSAFLSDWGRLTVFAMFVLLGAVAYAVATLVHSSANGFLFGIFTSLLAAIVGHGLVTWLWGDR